MTDKNARQELDLIQAARDELKLQLHLAKAEAKDRWRELEDRWLKVEGDLKHAGEQAVSDLDSTLKDAAHDLKEGYARLKAEIKS